MQSEPFFVAFKTLFTADACADLISALRQDALVWDALQSAEFFSSVSAYSGSHIELWNPGTIALLSLEKRLELQNLRSFPLLPLEPELRQLAARAYEDTLHSSEAPAILSEAGLLALALRERRRLTDTWQGLRNELQLKDSPYPDNYFAVWKTPLACLFAMAPDPVDLLQALAPTGSSPQSVSEIKGLVHAVLSNPLSLENQANLLFPVVSSLASTDQMTWFEVIHQMGRPGLAARLSSRLLANKSFRPVSKSVQQTLSDASTLSQDQSGESFQSMADTLQDIQDLRQLAAYHQYSGSPEQAIPLLAESVEALKNIQASVLIQNADASWQAGDLESAIAAHEKALELNPASKEIRLKFTVCLLNAGRYPQAARILPETSQDPDFLMAKAAINFHTNDRLTAQEYARQALAAKNNPVNSKGVIHPWFDPDLATRTLFNLGLMDESSTIAKDTLREQPVDIAALETLSQARGEMGDSEKAAEVAHLAVLLQPRQPELRRSFARILENAADWEQALKERAAILQSTSSPAQPDLLAYANCAIQAGQESLAETTCSALLENNPEDGLAHAYLGRALYQKGDIDKAMDHFTQATLLAPEEALPWLSLARAFEVKGEPYRAFETLRAAVLSSPQSAEIQFALGEACLSNGSPSEALPALRKAAALDPKSAPYAVRLGDILRDLGHLPESKQVLERARVYNPAHPELAYAHSKTLVALGEKQAAVTALLVKLDTQPKNVEPYLTYARLISETQPGEKWSLTHPKYSSKGLTNELKAQEALIKALEIEPDQIEARVLLAENYETTGKFNQALQLYKALADNKEIESGWNYRIKMGLGRTALALDQKDIALAALQEAAAEQPEDLSIQQTLAEAYYSANLLQEALQAARLAQRAAPQDMDNLIWFARLGYHLGAIAEVTLVLEKAIELNPLAFELYLNLFQIHTTNNHYMAAQEILIQLEANQSVDPQINRQEAYAWTVLGDLSKAIQSMTNAIQLAHEPTSDMWFELAQIQNQNKNPEAALSSIQAAIAIDPNRSWLHVFQAQMLIKLGRERAALACLEQALQLPGEINSAINPQSDSDSQAVTLLLPTVPVPNFIPVKFDPPSIHLMISRLQRSFGDLPTALTHAEKSLELAPSYLEGLSNTAELAFALLDYEVVRKITQGWEHPTADGSYSENQRLLISSLLAVEAELVLETGDLEAAGHIIEQAVTVSPKDPRALAIKARVMGLKGDLSAGEQLLEMAITLLNVPKDGAHFSASYPFYPNTFVDKPAERGALGEPVDEYPTLSIAEAELALFQWDGALALFDQVVRNSPMEPRPHLCLARALVKCAEYERICQQLDVILHAPGNDKIGEQSYQTFEREIMTANRLSNSPEVARWHKRGQAAYHPNLQSMKLLSGLPSNPDDSAALIAVCRELGEIQGAGDVARLYPDQVEVLLQHALALKETKPAEGFFSARTLVGFQPANPLYQSCLAVLAQEAQEIAIASEAIQNALQTWSNEAGWHLLAAELSGNCGDPESAIAHLEKAYAIEPENPAYALRLGKAYLTGRNYDKANEYLECVTRLTPNETEGWLALAEAQRQSGNLAKAIASAEKAISISPNQVQPLVTTGEIALQAGQIDLAYHHAQTALRMDASEGRALLLLIRCLSSQGHPADALTALDLALPSVANPLPLHLERVSLVRQLKGSPETLETLKDLAEEYPAEPAVLALLAEELANAGQRENAEKAAQAALQAEPNQPYLHLLVGRLQRNAGQLDQAIYHLSQAVLQNPEEMDAYLELGKAYQERRDQTQALSIYKQAIKVKPKDPRPYYQAGLALKESKDYPGSEIMLRHAAEISPDDVNIRRQLGAIIAINLVHNSQEASV